MRWFVFACVLAGTRLGATLVGPAPAPPPVQVVVPVGRMVEPLAPVVKPPLGAPPATAAHRITCGDPNQIGTPIAKLATESYGDHDWVIATSQRTCVIAGWTAGELIVSYDDGATFAPIAIAAKIQSVAIGDTGTLYVLRADAMLDIFHADGTTARRALVFANDEAVLVTRGSWLWLSHRVVGDQPSLSPDEGATWIHLRWTESYLADLAVLADGTVVGQSDFHGDVCDHFGCGDGPFTAEYETTLAGGPWKPATRSHARAVGTNSDGKDRHGFEIASNSGRLVRVMGSRLRALSTRRRS